jgi:hypothetical protein
MAADLHVHPQTSGAAHAVMTLENPASLPPIVIVTTLVDALSDGTWLASTSPVVAPEQATNVRFAPGRSALISAGYA